MLLLMVITEHEINLILLGSEFDEVLQAWRWPFIVSTTKMPTIQNVTEVKGKLDPLFHHLLMLQLPYPFIDI